MEDRAPALEGMVSTVLKYRKVTDVAKYLSSSKKLKKATLMEIKKEAQEYEKSNEILSGHYHCSMLEGSLER